MEPSRLEGVIDELRQVRERALVQAPVERVVEAVDQVARRLLDPSDSLRAGLLPAMEEESGYSSPMARTVLEGMARDWTREALEGLLASEFPDPRVLDRFCPAPRGGMVRALGYPLTFHLGAGTVPGVATTSLVRALLVKSASLLKPALGDRALPQAFYRGLREADPELARAVAVHYWPGEEGWPLTRVALGRADLVVVYGADETVARVREALPVTTRLVAYRHRLGLGLVGRAALEGPRPEGGGSLARTVAEGVARAVALFDQRGCVSPQVIFVEEGGEVSPREWAAELARALEALEKELPSGALGAREGAALQQLRGAGELRAAQGEGAIHHGGSRAPWTVLLEPGGGVEPTCLNRTVRVVPVAGMEEVLRKVKPWSRHLQSVGVAGLGEEEERVREALTRMGVSRMASFARVPWPRPWWHHDGEGPLRVLVRWTDSD